MATDIYCGILVMTYLIPSIMMVLNHEAVLVK